MADEPFGRQPQKVDLRFIGDPRDVDHYINLIKSKIEGSSYDHAVRIGSQTLRIFPRAVND